MRGSLIVILCCIFNGFWSANGEYRDDCQSSYCGNLTLHGPLGCGESPYTKLLRCKADVLHLRTVLGPFNVESIDYNSKTLIIHDPSMSTCSGLTPMGTQHFSPDSILRPAHDNAIVLLNCSHDSIIARNASRLCVNRDRTAKDVSAKPNCSFFTTPDCPAIEGLLARIGNFSTVPWCVTDFQRLGNVGFGDSGCSHYMGLYPVGKSSEEWSHGIRLSFEREGEGDVPDIGDFCKRCHPADRGITLGDHHRECGIGRECVCYPHRCENDFFSRALLMTSPPTLLKTIIFLSASLAGTNLWMIL